MSNEIVFDVQEELTKTLFPTFAPKITVEPLVRKVKIPEILLITTYPPLECGIATYSQDLLKALKNKYKQSFSIKVCALEPGKTLHVYPKEVKFVLDTSNPAKYLEMAHTINVDMYIDLVLVQHEFGLFQGKGEAAFLQFLFWLSKPAIVVFHTVLPQPDTAFQEKVQKIANACAAMIVMTQNAAQILIEDYGIAPEKIEVIPHGTHLVPHLDKNLLK